MAKADDDILRDAIIGTEKEIFAEGFGKEDMTLDGTGDRSLETMGDGLEGQHESEDDNDDADGLEGADDKELTEGETEKPVEPVAAKTEKTGEETTQQEPKGRVPAGRLREEAEARRRVEAERDTLSAQLQAKDQALSDLNAKVEAILAAQKVTQPAAPQPERPATPDLFEDPKAFVDHITKTVEDRFNAQARQQRDREVNASINAARERHGEAFQAAWTTLGSLPKNSETAQLVQRLEAAPNPGEAIVSWHKRQTAMLEVGEDLEGYKARVAEETRTALLADPEFRKEILASLRGDAMIGDQGRPRTTVKLPQSLSRTPGSNTRAPSDLEIFDGSDGATFASAWSTP